LSNEDHNQPEDSPPPKSSHSSFVCEIGWDRVADRFLEGIFDAKAG
jgi:hypothetical protein